MQPDLCAPHALTEVITAVCTCLQCPLLHPTLKACLYEGAVLQQLPCYVHMPSVNTAACDQKL